MSVLKVMCDCGWYVESNDNDTVITTCARHDATCPKFFEPDKILAEVIEE